MLWISAGGQGKIRISVRVRDEISGLEVSRLLHVEDALMIVSRVDFFSAGLGHGRHHSSFKGDHLWAYCRILGEQECSAYSWVGPQGGEGVAFAVSPRCKSVWCIDGGEAVWRG